MARPHASAAEIASHLATVADLAAVANLPFADVSDVDIGKLGHDLDPYDWGKRGVGRLAARKEPDRPCESAIAMVSRYPRLFCAFLDSAGPVATPLFCCPAIVGGRS